MKPRAVLLATVVVLVAPGVAAATIHIRRGTVVDEIRAIGQNVRVDGVARGPVVVIWGNLDVGPTGRVANVTVIGGRLRAAPQARLTGDVFQFGGPLPAVAGWRLVGALALLVAIRSLVVWLVVSAAALLARRPRLTVLTNVCRQRPLRTLLVGLLAATGLGALSVLLAITVVGLVFAAAIWGVLLIGLTVGVALTLAAFDHEREAQRLIRIVLLVPVLGDALAAPAALAGLGALVRYATLRPAAATAPLAKR
jgi:hypothetical protein